MNIVKKITIAAAFLCAVTVVNAEEGMKIGARVGYSTQMLDSYDMGLLGVQAGVAINIPAGPVIIAPEVAFVYRDNYSSILVKSQTEMAISVPIIVKYAFGNMFAGAGVQIDLPLGSEICYTSGNECYSMDGKETKTTSIFNPDKSPERSAIDLGIPFVFGYHIMPNLTVDARYVWGLMAYGSYTTLLTNLKADYGPLSSLGANATYFF